LPFTSYCQDYFKEKRGQATFSARKRTVSIMCDQALPSGKDVFPPLITGVRLYYEVIFKDEMQSNLHHYDKV